MLQVPFREEHEVTWMLLAVPGGWRPGLREPKGPITLKELTEKYRKYRKQEEGRLPKSKREHLRFFY